MVLIEIARHQRAVAISAKGLTARGIENSRSLQKSAVVGAKALKRGGAGPFKTDMKDDGSPELSHSRYLAD
jgi:hypothetical protein